jgi:hypothetical protein
MKEFRKAINELLENLEVKIKHDFLKTDDKELFDMMLNAYNYYQESERCGVDYIFDLNNKDDLTCLVDSGSLNARMIAELYNDSQVNTTSYFLYGENYEMPMKFATIYDVKLAICEILGDMLLYVLAYPFVKGAYKEVYENYVTEQVLTIIN